MDDEQTFAEALKAHGKPVRLHELHDNLSHGLREQLEFYRSMAPYTYCGFLDNLNFNAVAALRNDREFIGIYLGAIMVVARYAYCLLSDPDMFPSIGNVSAESIEPQVIENLRRPLEQERFPTARYLPRDPVRMRAAQHLAMCAYMILFFHELAHIELCHLKFLTDELGLPEYQEVTAMPLSEEEALLLRALEWDADNSALMTSLKVWRQTIANIDYSAIASLGAARSWFVAAQLLFWVMDFIQPPHRRGLLATHPSPNARLVNATMAAKQYGFVPELSDVSNVAEDSLVSWIIKNDFRSHMVASACANTSVDRTVQELVEARENYEKIMARLMSYQEVRLRGRGVFPPEFPTR